MKEIARFCINLQPRTKKNSMQIFRNKNTNRPVIMPSRLYQEYKNDAGWYLGWSKEPIDQLVNIECHFYMNSKRRVDLTNLLECIDDVLTEHKVIADDNCRIVVSHDGSRVHYDKARPRTEVYIYEYEESDKLVPFGEENDNGD